MHRETVEAQRLSGVELAVSPLVAEEGIDRNLRNLKVLTLVLLDAKTMGSSENPQRSGLNQAISYCPDYEETVWMSVAVKNGAILARLWPFFRWQQLLPAFPRAAARTIRACTFPSSIARVRLSRRRANLPAWQCFRCHQPVADWSLWSAIVAPSRTATNIWQGKSSGLKPS